MDILPLGLPEFELTIDKKLKQTSQFILIGLLFSFSLSKMQNEFLSSKESLESFLGLGCHCILSPSNGKGGLYLSNLKKAEDVAHLIRFGITAMVSIMEDDPPASLCELIRIKHLYIDALDSPSSRISDHFEVSNHFIRKELENGNVQVHCHMGVSRSASLVIAFIMDEMGKSFQESLDFVRKRRPCILPNDGFLIQLKEYEGKLSQMKQETSKNAQNKKKN